MYRFRQCSSNHGQIQGKAAILALRVMQTDLELITQNSMVQGWLKDFQELNEMMGDEDVN
jgi:hypothetical protein